MLELPPSQSDCFQTEYYFKMNLFSLINHVFLYSGKGTFSVFPYTP